MGLSRARLASQALKTLAQSQSERGCFYLFDILRFYVLLHLKHEFLGK